MTFFFTLMNLSENTDSLTEITLYNEWRVRRQNSVSVTKARVHMNIFIIERFHTAQVIFLPCKVKLYVGLFHQNAVPDIPAYGGLGW